MTWMLDPFNPRQLPGNRMRSRHSALPLRPEKMNDQAHQHDHCEPHQEIPHDGAPFLLTTRGSKPTATCGGKESRDQLLSDRIPSSRDTRLHRRSHSRSRRSSLFTVRKRAIFSCKKAVFSVFMNILTLNSKRNCPETQHQTIHKMPVPDS